MATNKEMGPQMKKEMTKKNQELPGNRSNLDSLLSSNKNPSSPIDGQNSAELRMFVENVEKSIGYIEIEGTGATLRDIREVVGELKCVPKEFLFLEGQHPVPRDDEEHRPAEAFLPQIVLRDLNPPASDGDDRCMLHIFAEGNPESVGAVKIAKDHLDGATLAELREVCGNLDGIPEHFVFLRANSIVPRQDEATTRAVHFLPRLIVREERLQMQSRFLTSIGFQCSSYDFLELFVRKFNIEKTTEYMALYLLDLFMISDKYGIYSESFLATGALRLAMLVITRSEHWPAELASFTRNPINSPSMHAYILSLQQLHVFSYRNFVGHLVHGNGEVLAIAEKFSQQPCFGVSKIIPPEYPRPAKIVAETLDHILTNHNRHSQLQ